MTEETKLISELAPALGYVLGAILLIIFVKKYLFLGMVPTEMHTAQLARERDIITVSETIANHLDEIVRQLESLTKKVSEEIGNNTERLSSLERAMSDYLDAFQDLNNDLIKRRCMVSVNDK
jgi:hypothetical protein